MSKKPVKGIRQASNHFLVGPEEPDLGKEVRQGRLPWTREVVKYLFYRKNLKTFKYKPVKNAICCPLKSGDMKANCEENPDCSFPNECVVWKVKTDARWLETGIPIISDVSITKKLHKEFKALDKHKKQPNAEPQKKESFH